MLPSHFDHSLLKLMLDCTQQKARSIGKAYIAGEYDWTDRYSRLPLLAGLIPVVLVGLNLRPWIRYCQRFSL